MYCWICGTKFNEDERFCRQCGTEKDYLPANNYNNSDIIQEELKEGACETETVKETPIQIEIVEMIEEKIPSLASDVYVYVIIAVTMIAIYFLMFSTNLMV